MGPDVGIKTKQGTANEDYGPRCKNKKHGEKLKVMGPDLGMG